MPKLKINRARLEALKESDPAKYEEMVSALAEVEAIRVENPLQFFEPHPKGHLFMSARAPESELHVRLFTGGNQSGKTTHSLADDVIQAVDEECLPERLKQYKRFQPPFYGRIITPDFTRTMEGVVHEKLKEILPRSQLVGGGWDKAYDTTSRKLRFANGSWIDFLTFEQDLDKFGGATLDRVHFDEEPPGDKGRRIYNQARVRVMARGGDILFSMTPEEGMTWMFDEIYERSHEPDVTVVEVWTDDNPHIPPEKMEASFKGMTPDEVEVKRKGRMVAFSGPVLKGWSDEVHMVDPPSTTQLEGQDIIVGIDPGMVRGAVVWGAFDRDDVLLIFDELYPEDLEATQVAELIQAKNREWGVKPVYYVIDPSGSNRTQSGTVLEEYTMAGIPCVKGKNARKPGIGQLRRRLHADRPALLVSRACTNWHFERRRWRVAKHEGDDRPKSGDTGDTFATTGPDHLMDATRYVAMERFWGPVAQEKSRNSTWNPGHAPPAEWFEGRRPQDTSPMGAFS